MLSIFSYEFVFRLDDVQSFSTTYPVIKTCSGEPLAALRNFFFGIFQTLITTVCFHMEKL